MGPDRGPFQEPDEPQLLLIVGAGDSDRFGHGETANKIFVYKRPIWWPWGAMIDCLRMGAHALLAGIGFAQMRVAWTRRPICLMPANVARPKMIVDGPNRTASCVGARGSKGSGRATKEPAAQMRITAVA
jgi:hypothetical protein